MNVFIIIGVLSIMKNQREKKYPQI